MEPFRVDGLRISQGLDEGRGAVGGNLETHEQAVQIGALLLAGLACELQSTVEDVAKSSRLWQ